MAWEARSGLKQKHYARFHVSLLWLNGLGSPFGIETYSGSSIRTDNTGLNGLGSPFGIETKRHTSSNNHLLRLNGLGSPFGIETIVTTCGTRRPFQAKWPGKPVRD